MSTMLIANNPTRENGGFMGDQLCSLKTAYLFVENEPSVDKVLMSMSPANEMNFLWVKFIRKYDVEVVWDDWNPGDWDARFAAWDKWRKDREINGRKFDHYRELYLRIHGAMRQTIICGSERGLGRRNIYEYWFYGQENMPETCEGADWFDDTLIDHPPHQPLHDVYISPHCKTQGNVTFTFQYWADVVHHLVDAGVSVTVGYDGCCGPFCEDLNDRENYKRHWGDHRQWMEQVCMHKLVACGNTGTGWLAAACGVPLITMEPHNSVMADHRYRECGLKNLVEVIDGYKLDEMGNDMVAVAEYCARRIMEEVGVAPRRQRTPSVSEALRIGAPYSVNPPAKLKLMADKLLSVADLPGDIADIGAYKGGTSVILCKLTPDKHLHLFDTWNGNPYNDDLCHHKKGEWKATLNECETLVGNSDLTHYYKGVFPNVTLSEQDTVDRWVYCVRDRQFCFVYVDGDTYQTTRDAINFFWLRLVQGGMLFFDDYGWEPCAGVKKAVDEVFTEDQREVIVAQHTCVVVKK